MITTAHVYATLFIHLGVIAVASAHLVASAALFPNFASAARERVERHLASTIAIGLAISLPWAVLAAVLLSRGGPIGLLGAILGIAWVLLGLLGCGGLALRAGGARAETADAPRWWLALRGAVVVTLTWALPLAGWFVLLPLTLAIGIGCVVTARRRTSEAPSERDPSMTVAVTVTAVQRGERGPRPPGEADGTPPPASNEPEVRRA
ncbi:MAG TPA: hypothetical protein PKC43_09575 [Phycisphaerales bacterium]|nr:hypothetical protein [Phycisphaerales bacterium]HMP37683.1 hypothetical protein [Phycisphaerales bacterium]